MPWKLFDTPIVHNQIPMTSLSCLVSLLFLKCALFLNWRSQLGHWLEDSMGSLLYMSWNILPKEFLMICCKSMNYHHWLLPDEIQSAKKYCFSKSHHHFVIISSTQNYFYLLCYIVNSNQYLLTAKKRMKRSHEIDALYIKNLNYQNKT